MKEKLQESDGINQFFTWMVRGAKGYYENLRYIKIKMMRAGREVYLRLIDPISQFLDDTFEEVVDPEDNPGIKASEMYE